MKTNKSLIIVIALVAVFAMGSIAFARPSITMWMQNYGDRNDQMKVMKELAQEFKDQTGISVNFEIINWSTAFNKWTLVSKGGPAPDVGDMFWLYSNVAMGGGEHGPRPLDKYKDILKPERFSNLKDVTYKGHLYGLPWRTDIRPMVYRDDMLKDAGLSGPPSTWTDLVEYGKKLTQKDSTGKTVQWGVTMREMGPQIPLPWIWMAGGEVMTLPDGETATLNTPEAKDAMQFIRDMLYKWKIMPESVMDPSYEGVNDLMNDKVAIIPDGHSELYELFAQRKPDKLEYLKAAVPLKRKIRSAFMGAGYFGVQYASDNVEASAKWIGFLGSAENQLRLAKFADVISPNIKAGQDPFYQDNPFYAKVIESIQYGHPSQHPNPAWQMIMTDGPGGVMYDLWERVLAGEEPLDKILSEQEAKMQELMDKSK